MSDGLQQLWGLESLGNRTAGSQQAEQFHRAFSQVMAQANQAMQSTAVQANHAEHAALDAQRTRIYDAYLMASRRIDATDPTRAERDISRVLAVVSAFRDRASALARQSGALSEEWSQHETEFDDLVDRVGELESADHPKAPAMRELADAIRTRSNDHDYRNSLSALSQVRPKVEAAYQQHQESDHTGNGAPAIEAERTEPRGTSAASEESTKATGEDSPTDVGSQRTQALDATHSNTDAQREAEQIDERASYVGSSIGSPSRSPSQGPDAASVESAASQPGRKPESPNRIEPHEATTIESQRPTSEQPSTPTSAAGETQSAELPTGGGVGSVFFRVKNHATGVAVEGARISIGDENLVTDALGAEAWALPTGRTDYSVTADGFQPISGNVNVVANGDANVDVGLMPLPEGVTGASETRREVGEPSQQEPTAGTAGVSQRSAEAAPHGHEAQHEPTVTSAGDGLSHDASHSSRPLSPEERDRMHGELDRMEADLARLRSEHAVLH